MVQSAENVGQAQDGDSEQPGSRIDKLNNYCPGFCDRNSGQLWEVEYGSL
jgi:hypothetical protein